MRNRLANAVFLLIKATPCLGHGLEGGRKEMALNN